MYLPRAACCALNMSWQGSGWHAVFAEGDERQVLPAIHGWEHG